MPSTSSERDPVEILAEEFVARHRRGERPSLTEYTDRLPEHADEIRELFPALVVMEQLKPDGELLTDIGSSPPQRDQLPDRLGDYRILREVGRGGMGVVYEAEQISLGRHVALKVLPAHGLLNRTFLERFRREAKAAAKLHHTNIVPVFGVGEANGVHFYAMQFIRGEGLDKVLDDVERLRQRSAAGSEPQPREFGSQSVAQSLLEGSFSDLRQIPLSATLGSGAQPGSAGERQHQSRESGDIRRPQRRRISPQRRPARPAGRRGAGLRASAGRLAPRHQTLKSAFGYGGNRLDHRLRPGESRRLGGIDPGRRYRRHHPLHGPGAVRRAFLAPERYLFARHHPLRNVGAASSV